MNIELAIGIAILVVVAVATYSLYRSKRNGRALAQKQLLRKFTEIR